MLKLQRRVGNVDPDRVQAAQQLLLAHHGTRGEAVLAMAGDGFTKVRKHKIHQEDWLCPKCNGYVFKKKDACPGLFGRSSCGTRRTPKSPTYSQCCEGKAAAAAADKNRQGGGGGGGGGGGQNAGTSESAELRRSRANEKRLQEQVRSLQQGKKAAEDDMDDGENDEDGVDADSKKAELETLLANADDDFKYAAQKLKKDPK